MKEQIFINSKDFAGKLVIASEDENETCGLMIGKGNIVHEIVMMKNEQPSPVFFAVSAMKAGEIIMDAMSRGLKVIGVFHSHPNNHPQPSATDFDYMGESWPQVWTIYSPCYKTWASWRREGDKILPVTTVMTEMI